VYCFSASFGALSVITACGTSALLSLYVILLDMSVSSGGYYFSGVSLIGPKVIPMQSFSVQRWTICSIHTILGLSCPHYCFGIH